MSEELVIPGIDQEEIGTLLSVRTYSQYRVEQILSGTCPFCKLDRNKNEVLRVSGEWRLWKNPYPHAHTKEHFIIAPIQHLTNLCQMYSNDWDDVAALIDYVVNPETCGGMAYEGGAVVIRYGDPRLNAGSIRHLHVNIIVPDGTGRVQATLAKTPEDIERKKKILTVFEKVRTGTPMSTLTDEELSLVTGRMW